MQFRTGCFVVHLLQTPHGNKCSSIKKRITNCLFSNKHADQCPSMAVAIKSTLIGTLHKLCRWHILKKYKDHLSLLYKAYETSKDELTSVLNHPLMPSEFKRAWQDLMGKYDLQNDEIMN